MKTPNSAYAFCCLALLSSTSCGPTAAGSSLLPTEAGALAAFLDAKEYATWSCEASVTAATQGSPHGKKRVCSNATLAQATSAPWPVGSASVKEVYDADGITLLGHTWSEKRKASGSDAFFWFERLGTEVQAQGGGVVGTAPAVCVSCHQGASTDMVFVRVGGD